MFMVWQIWNYYIQDCVGKNMFLVRQVQWPLLNIIHMCQIKRSIKHNNSITRFIKILEKLIRLTLFYSVKLKIRHCLVLIVCKGYVSKTTLNIAFVLQEYKNLKYLFFRQKNKVGDMSTNAFNKILYKSHFFQQGTQIKCHFKLETVQ